MGRTGGWHRRAKIIGLWESSYLTRVNVPPGSFHRLAEVLCNQRRAHMWMTGQMRRAHQHEHRKAKWLLEDAIHCVRYHLNMQTCKHTTAASSLTPAFKRSREGI